MAYRLEKRVRFVGECLNQKLATANQANEWYIANKGHTRDNWKNIDLFKAWLARDNEPNLGQMFDMAYEDQCRDACGL